MTLYLRIFIMKKLYAILIIILSSFLFSGFLSNYFEITKNLEIFNNIYRQLEISYVEPINPGDLMKKTIDRMLETLDPWTIYIPESDVEDYREKTITGDYGGIGSKIRKIDDFVVIAEPFKNSPADKAGLKIGDKIIAINGENLQDVSTSDVSELLRGSAGTNVNITLENTNGALKNVEIKREKIHTSTVPHYELLENNTGYVKLTQFKRKSAQEIKHAIAELIDTSNNNLNGLILDLRNNGGGLLSECREIVNLFVPKGDTILIAKGKSESWNKQYITSKNPLYEKIPIAVLINENSASASEIVSGCLQDLDRGVIIGRKSFGKGLIQQNQKIAYNTQLKLTVAKYYTPSGRCIQKVEASIDSVSNTPLKSEFFTKNGRKVYGGGGIDPDIEIESKKGLPILIALLKNNCVFKFGNELISTIDFPKSAKDFHLSSENYDKFKNYIERENLPFSMYSEEAIKLLEESLKDEFYLENMENQVDELKESIIKNKKDDLIRYESDIRKLISNDLILRNFYQNGVIQYNLKTDSYIAKALEILSDQKQYADILSYSE